MTKYSPIKPFKIYKILKFSLSITLVKDRPLEQFKSKDEFEKSLEASETKSWKFFMPFGADCIEKSLSSTKTEADPKSWKISGVASSTEEDLENEIVVPEGIDTSYFLKFGWFNSEHKKGAAFKVGIPTKAECTRKGLEIEGYLLKDMPEAQGIYTLMKTLAEGKHDRKVGYSIEGKTVLQEGKRILKSFLIDIAITANPVNTTTYGELMKSLKTCATDNSLESMSYLSVDKTMEAGYAVEGQTGGSALRVQDLERKLKILTNKGLSPDEAVEYVMLKTGFDKLTAMKALKYTDYFLKAQGR